MTLAGSYLDREELKAYSVAPSSLIDGDWIDPAGAWSDASKVAARATWWAFIDARLVYFTSKINAQLGKRYAVPFGEPSPAAIKGWLADIVTPEIYGKRGWDTEDAHAQWVIAKAQAAWDDIGRAADEVAGLYELPLRQDTLGEGLGVDEGPRVYSETSPYDWMDQQRDDIRGRR